MHKQAVPYSGQEYDVPFPFGPEWQVKLLKLLLVDDGSLDVVMRHVKVTYFQADETRWIYGTIFNYWSTYGQAPTADALRYYAKKEGGQLASTIPLVVNQVEQADLKDREMMKVELLDWARQNHFHTSFRESLALWNSGKRLEAMDVMQRRVDELMEVQWANRDRMFYAEELARREQLRVQKLDELGETGDTISTGVPDLDEIMGGGISPGELCIWMAYAKGGKSTLLLNHGAVAAQVKKRVLHFVLEGSMQQVADRYDAFFSHETYAKVKLGKLGQDGYKHLFDQLQTIKDRLVIIDLAKKFDNTILDINQELLDLQRVRGWRPDLVIIDYGDLLHGRLGPYQAGWMSERDAFRDMKLLANRGYAVWTASQARRPDTKNYDTNEHLLKVAQVAGAIEKARVCDFIGSINSTVEERQNGWLRLYAEMYRDNQAGQVITLATEPSQMRFVGVQKEAPAGVGHGPGVIPATPPLGYTNGTAKNGHHGPIGYGGVIQNPS